MNIWKTEEVNKLITDYFEGIYTGDIRLLDKGFYTQALLFGDINRVPYFKTASEYIASVKIRKSPKELGEDFNMEMLSVEIIGDQAMMKVHLPMLGFNYYDMLSLSKINGEWKIVNKLFSHVS